MTEKHVFFVAGEASGDAYGAQIIEELKKLDPDIRVSGLGGDKMGAAGMNLLYNLAREFAVVGFLPVILGMPKVMRFLEITLDFLDRTSPDVVVLIDYPGFNLYLATHLKKRNIPIIYYITPQIWAWNPGRIKKIKQLISKMLVIFPFEVDFYRKADIPVEYVGHPLLDRLALFHPDSNFHKRHHFAQKQILAVLPGSRRMEITHNLPVMLWLIKKLKEKCEIPEVCIALASEKYKQLVKDLLSQSACADLPEVKIITGDTYNVVHHAHFVLSTSGTATLETAVMGKPLVVVYKVHFYHKWIVEKTSFLKCSYFALPNIISNKKIVPEYLVSKSKPDYLLEDMQKLWDDTPERRQCLQDVGALKAKLERPGASTKAARVIFRSIQ